MNSDFRPCVIIPVFNHPLALGDTVTQLLALKLTILLVDDGSDEPCLKVEQSLASTHVNVLLFERACNGGKGGAVKDGLRQAKTLGFTHAIQIDADGQHNIEDIPQFLEQSKSKPDTLVAGSPCYDESVPKHRLYARYLTHIWVWINTLSFDIKDSMCGFRAYPVERSVELIDRDSCGERMEFDTEFMVRWHWNNWPIQQFKTRVIYPAEGISHFLPQLDNWLIAKMHTRLFFGMLLRLPKLVRQKSKPRANIERDASE